MGAVLSISHFPPVLCGGVGANPRLIASTLKGLDFDSTTPPSQYQMFKLVTNRKFVRAVKRVMEELNAAGLRLKSDVRTLSIGSPWLLVRGVHSLYVV
jgi:hypothetical protein